MVAGSERGRHLGPRPAGADGHAVAQRLGHGDDVRLQTLGLEGEPVAGAPEPGLNLVEHEERVALRAQRPHGTEVVRARHDDPTLALDRLEQDAGHGVAVEGLVERGDVVVGHVHEPLGEGEERRLLLRLARGRQRGQGPAVECVVGADHDVAPATGPAPGQLERALVGLRSGIGEEHLPAGLPGTAVDQPVDGTGHLGRQRVAVEVRDVAQRPRLRGHGIGDDGMGMAQRHDRQPGDEVEVLLAVGVEQDGALAPHEGGRRLGVGAHERVHVLAVSVMAAPSCRRPSR